MTARKQWNRKLAVTQLYASEIFSNSLTAL
jgi:hypothetical protein